MSVGKGMCIFPKNVSDIFGLIMLLLYFYVITRQTMVTVGMFRL